MINTIYRYACAIADEVTNTVILTGGFLDETGHRVSRYNRNGWISPDLPNLNQGRWHHACGTFVDSNSNTVLPEHTKMYLIKAYILIYSK